MATDSYIEQIHLITKFESMPNELLMEIFEYYDLYSLLCSFGSINSRIDNIIYHCQVFVDFDQVKEIDCFDFIRHIIPKFNAKNIRSLNASNSYQTGLVIFYDKSLHFTHIRSLSVNNIPSDFVEYMFRHIHFPHLERFIFGECNGQYINKCLIFKYLLNSNRYPSLRTYKDSCNVIRDVTTTSYVEYVTFSRPSLLHYFFNFLNQSPCLKYIKAPLYFRNQYSKPLFLSAIHHNDTLTHLNVDLLGKVCMETTVYLLKCVPRLYHLKLYVESTRHPQLADPVFWETVLCKYLTELKQLSLNALICNEYRSTDPIWNSLANEEKVIERIKKSNYWSSHQWKTTFTSGLSKSQIFCAKLQVV